MRYPRLLICEHDGRLARFFNELEQAKKVWTVHEPRQLSDCVELLGEQGPAVLILRFGRDPEHELEFLEQVGWRFPETACLVVSDTDNPTLLGLAWDLGARHVLPAAEFRDQLPALAAAFLGVPLG
jgi:DNA-binding NarL/FixJ family response regulator